MQLFYSPTSPYVRKVRLIALAKGVADQMNGVLIDTSAPDNPQLFAANPLGKVPALILDNGEFLVDSPVICRYLDSLGEPRLLPQQGWKQFEVLRWEALADGLMDAAYNRVMEERSRPEHERSPRHIQRWEGEIQRSLSFVEQHLTSLGTELNLAHFALAAALAYLEFRLPHLFPNASYPALNTWFSQISEHPFMQATRP